MVFLVLGYHKFAITQMTFKETWAVTRGTAAPLHCKVSSSNLLTTTF